MNLKFILFLFFITLVCLNSYSQSVPGPFDTNSFSDLNERRTRINVLIPELEKQLINLGYVRDSGLVQFDIKNMENSIKWFEEKISKLDDADTSKKNFEFWLEDNRQRKESLSMELAKAKETSSLKIIIQKSLDSASAVRREVEYKINQLMIPKLSQQNFMFWASIAFMVLMCLLLGTFSSVVSRDQGVRRMIFGSDSGIQFVTLFSIIIAIILFGLTGVLEGKELSALLGSVAGYILGKAKFTNDKLPESAEGDNNSGESKGVEGKNGKNKSAKDNPDASKGAEDGLGKNNRDVDDKASENKSVQDGAGKGQGNEGNSEGSKGVDDKAGGDKGVEGKAG